jgi:hypothetical protein
VWCKVMMRARWFTFEPVPRLSLSSGYSSHAFVLL